MLTLSTANLMWLLNSQAKFLLQEELIPEIHFINLTDWGWLLLLSVVILVIWVMIVVQSNSKDSHPFGVVSDSDISHDPDDH